MRKYDLRGFLICVLLSIMCLSFSLVYCDDVIVDTSNHTYSYEEMIEDINLLDNKFPEQIEVSTIGYSVDGREIKQIILGNKNAKNAIWIQSTIHGREWMNTWVLMASLEQNLNNWNSIAPHGCTYAEVFNNCCIYLVPMVNPDGVCISQRGIESINNEALRNNIYNMSGSNNPRRWKANANGVDLNRQFITGWNTRVDVTAPASENYNGVAPFTEPEVLAIKDGLNQRGFIAAISYHSMEGAIYWDLGQTDDLRDRTLALATHCKNITTYRLGETSPMKGLEYNYMIMNKGIPSVVIETGTVQCPLPYSQWKKIYRQNNMLMVALAGCYQ